MSIIDAAGKAGSRIFNRTLGRLFGAGLEPGAESVLRRSGEAKWSGRDTVKDWRAKLTIPTGNSTLSDIFFTSELMSPLADMNGIVFPLTPSIILQHQASYNPMTTTHNNQPFYAYQNSESSSFSCIGEFPVQNSDDAKMWVATLHFLRTVTKMFFGGNDANKGNPPPILKFNAYGDHVFKNVPVVVTNFSVELTQGVDYIATSRGETVTETEASEGTITPQSSSVPQSWAPAVSMFNVMLQPVYSRKALTNFSLQEFVRGDLNNVSGDKDKEGYGFI